MLEESQLSIFGADCKTPAAGPQTVLSVEQKFVSSFKNKSVDLGKTYTNEFADKASAPSGVRSRGRRAPPADG